MLPWMHSGSCKILAEYQDRASSRKLECNCIQVRGRCVRKWYFRNRSYTATFVIPDGDLTCFSPTREIPFVVLHTPSTVLQSPLAMSRIAVTSQNAAGANQPKGRGVSLACFSSVAVFSADCIRSPNRTMLSLSFVSEFTRKSRACSYSNEVSCMCCRHCSND